MWLPLYDCAIYSITIVEDMQNYAWDSKIPTNYKMWFPKISKEAIRLFAFDNMCMLKIQPTVKYLS